MINGDIRRHLFFADRLDSVSPCQYIQFLNPMVSAV